MGNRRKALAAQQPRRPVLECLAQEHRHIAALLGLLEQRVANTRKLTTGDLYLLADVIGYLHDFPDQVHHPTENLLFDRLQKRRPDLAPELAGLRQEHEQLAAETRLLLDALEQAIAAHDAVRPSSLRTRIKHFVASQRAHMEREGRSAFGAAITDLSETDWRALERRTELHEDPLFGPGVQPRQRLLFEYLVHPGRRSATAMLAGGMELQERWLDMAGALENGVSEALGVFENAARALFGETRNLLLGEQHYADPWQRIIWPWHYGQLVGRAAWQGGGALLKASGKTARGVCAAALRRQQPELQRQQQR
jgi:hemerythrin-like domain-containing protein